MSLAEPRLVARTARPALHGSRIAAASLTLGLTAAIVAAFSINLTSWTPTAFAALGLVTLAALWISGGAATALIGQFATAPSAPDPEEGWRPQSRTAILVMMCKEDPAPVAQHLAALHTGLALAGLQDATDIFVLSDTSGHALIDREEAVFGALTAAGHLHYRRRAENIGRKPGNISDWLATHGPRFDHMLVLDADSRMSPARIRHMIWQMDRRPDLGLLQAGIALRPGTTRFGRHQRTAARLLSRGFGRGFAAWTGDSGNYWGHNAIIRVAAFRAATALPMLKGRAPWGGSVLSHDFVEAAWIRRAGWAIALDPKSAGSAEEAPQTVAAFNARDRRWCQGNLQHLRLITEPGLDPVSRLHLAMGILSYLVAPIWLLLVALLAFGAVPVAGAWPVVVAAAVLLTPKVCAVAEWWHLARTPYRRAIVLRAALGELAISSLIAPLVMLRQAGAVLAVILGRDCGWKSGGDVTWRLGPGVGEALTGWTLLALAILASGASAVWLAPSALGLCLAPVLIRLLDAPA